MNHADVFVQKLPGTECTLVYIAELLLPYIVRAVLMIFPCSLVICTFLLSLFHLFLFPNFISRLIFYLVTRSYIVLTSQSFFFGLKEVALPQNIF